jgi:hypothetical protein
MADALLVLPLVAYVPVVVLYYCAPLLTFPVKKIIYFRGNIFEPKGIFCCHGSTIDSTENRP